MENRNFLNRNARTSKSSSYLKVLLSVAVTSILLVVLIPLMMNSKGKGTTKKSASDKFKVVKEMPKSTGNTAPEGLALNPGTVDPPARDQKVKPDPGIPGAGPLTGATAPAAGLTGTTPPVPANPPVAPFGPVPSPAAGPMQTASLPPAAPAPSRPATPPPAPSSAVTHSPPVAPSAATAPIPGRAPSASSAVVQPPSGTQDNKVKPVASSEKVVKAMPGNGGNPRAGSSSQVKAHVPLPAERTGSGKPAASTAATGVTAPQKSKEQASVPPSSGQQQAQASHQQTTQKPAAKASKDKQPAAGKDKDKKKQDNTNKSAATALASVSPEVKAKEKEPAPASGVPKESAGASKESTSEDGALKSNGTTTTSTKRNQQQYVVQFGAYHEMKNAEVQQENLKKKGYSAKIRSHFDQKKGQLYLVQMEPVDDANKANNMLSRIKQEGAEAPIVLKVGAAH